LEDLGADGSFNMKMHLRETGMEVVDRIQLTQNGFSRGILWTP